MLKLCLVAVLTAVAQAQQFDVASVKPAPPLTPATMGQAGRFVGGPGSSEPDHIRVPAVSLRLVIMTAYDMKTHQIAGPSWIDTERFDFAVTVPEGATKAQVGVMWQNLLKERFGMVMHHESKEFAVDELVIGRGGHKLKDNVEENPNAEGPARVENEKLSGPGFVSRIGSTGTMAEGSILARAQTLVPLVNLMTGQNGRPVVDKTGLTGKYDFEVQFTYDLPGLQPNGGTAAAGITASDDPRLTLLLAVQQQLGLRLERSKAMLDTIVVDKAEKVPTEN
jgi:uncharacterized protein (TIGR03435 family)